MVLPSPPAELGPPPPELSGLQRIERTLRLVDDGAIVVVQAPWPATIEAAVRRLVSLDSDLAVVEHFEEFRAAARPGRLIVWNLRPDDARLANLYRERVRAEKLRVVVWTHPADDAVLRDTAPDFFDWARTTIILPAEPPRALLCAIADARRAPGVVWRGPGLDAVYAHAAPDARCWRIRAPAHYAAAIESLEALRAPDRVVWQGSSTTAR